MNRLFNSISVVAACFAILASCSKEPGKPSESVITFKIDGVEHKASCCICNPDPDYDGINFFFVDKSLAKLLDLEFAPSLLGTTIDLTELDPYAGQEGHYKFFVGSDVFEGIGIAGWDEEGLADSGSLKVEKLGESKYKFDLEYTVCDHSVVLHSEVDIVVPGPAKQSVLKYDGNSFDVETVEYNRYLDNDGVYFYAYDADGNILLDVEFAFSLLGKEIDLTKLDVYAGDNDNHYNFYVDGSYFQGIKIWGGDDEETVLADSGSLIVNYLGRDQFSINLNYTLGEHTVDFVYEGSVVCNLW